MRNNCALITPTYRGHFYYIQNYLRSLSRFLLDKNIPIYLIIERKDALELKALTEEFRELNIHIINFEKILESFGISLSPDFLLEKYGKFSYQTLKKFYTTLYIPERYSLILDSESMMIQKSDLYLQFESFFSSPFIAFTKLNDRKKPSIFLQEVVSSSSFLLNTEDNSFYLENFVWFYDKMIVQDMVNLLSEPLHFVDRLYKNDKKDLFEIQLYHQFIYLNKEKYGYNAINIYEILRNSLDIKELEEYLQKYTLVCEGNCGLLERVGTCVNSHNYVKIANIVKKLNFNIIRSDCYENIFINNKTINIINPIILAASQNHSFGIKANLRNKLMDLTDTRMELPIVYNLLYNFIKNNKLCQFLYYSIIVSAKCITVPIKNLITNRKY